MEARVCVSVPLWGIPVMDRWPVRHVRQWMLLHSDFNIFVHNQLMFSFSEISERTFLKS